MNDISVVYFGPNETTAVASGLDQWDYGQKLEIHGLSLPSVLQVHFAFEYDEKMEAIRNPGSTVGDITTVDIPNKLLETAGVLLAFIYISDADHGRTDYRIRIPVMARQMPGDFATVNDPDGFGEIIDYMNDIYDNTKEVYENTKVAVDLAVPPAVNAKFNELATAQQIDSEVILARDGYTSLDARLDDMIPGNRNLILEYDKEVVIVGTNVSNQTFLSWNLIDFMKNIVKNRNPNGYLSLSFDWWVEGETISGRIRQSFNAEPWNIFPDSEAIMVTSDHKEGHFAHKSLYKLGGLATSEANKIGFRLDNFQGTLHVKNLCFQIGTIPTDGGPSPEEIYSKIAAKQDLLPHHKATQSDFNSITIPGWYWIDPNVTTVNRPVGAFGLLEVIGNNPLDPTQRFIALTGEQYTRHHINATNENAKWLDWFHLEGLNSFYKANIVADSGTINNLNGRTLCTFVNPADITDGSWPFPSAYGYLLNLNGMQIAYEWVNNTTMRALAFRSYINSTWTSWSYITSEIGLVSSNKVERSLGDSVNWEIMAKLTLQPGNYQLNGLATFQANQNGCRGLAIGTNSSTNFYGMVTKNAVTTSGWDTVLSHSWYISISTATDIICRVRKDISGSLYCVTTIQAIKLR